jgi:hypothetical protein
MGRNVRMMLEVRIDRRAAPMALGNPADRTVRMAPVVPEDRVDLMVRLAALARRLKV